jgi:tetratricopeptide (TPR) repeat protein
MGNADMGRHGGRGISMRQILALSAAILVLVFGGAPTARADDQSTCFSTGTEDYKKKEAIQPGINACSRLISSRSGTGQAAAYRARGYWKHQKGDLDAAIEDYNVAIRLDPKNMEGYDYRADVWQDKGDLDRALADYDMATRVDPTYAAAYYSRGRVYETKGDIERARQEYNAALAVPPKDRIAEWAQRGARDRLAKLGQR